MAERINGQVNDRDLNLIVADLIDDNKRWNLNNLHSTVDDEIKKSILQLHVAWSPNLSESYYWSWTKNGQFSIKSTYFNLCLDCTATDLAYEWIWKLPTPSKVRVLVWFCCYNRLHTQQYRATIGIANSDLCSLCGEGTEDCCHILRDCKYARKV